MNHRTLNNKTLTTLTLATLLAAPALAAPVTVQHDRGALTLSAPAKRVVALEYS